MALLPDLGLAALYGLVVFLLALGFLVVFLERIPNRRLIAGLLVVMVLTLTFLSVGETGAAIVMAGVGAAFLANHAFEWLTSR